MLTVTRNDSRVEIKFSIAVPLTIGYTYTLGWTASGGEDHAGFIAGAMQAALGDYIQKQRETWYEKGWRDKASHRVKRDWFPRIWEWRD